MFVQIFSVKTSSSLEDSALVTYPIHAVLLSFRDVYKKWLVQSGHILVAILSVVYAVKQQGGIRKLAGMEESLHGYSSSAIVKVRK